MSNKYFRGMPAFFLLFASASQPLYADCRSPSGSYEVMACKATASFAGKHLARDVAEAQTRAIARRSSSTFLQPNSANSSQIVDIYNSARIQRCASRTMQVWSCAYNATDGSSTCTAQTQALYFSKYTTGTGGVGKIYHLDSNPAATAYGTLGTCTFR